MGTMSQLIINTVDKYILTQVIYYKNNIFLFYKITCFDSIEYHKVYKIYESCHKINFQHKFVCDCKDESKFHGMMIVLV